MKKKILFVTFCLILFLIFTALGYGDIDPKYKARGHPWGHMLSPRPDDNQNLDLVLIVINPDLYILFGFQSKVENFRNSDELAKHKSDSYLKQYDSLTKNETKSKR